MKTAMNSGNAEIKVDTTTSISPQEASVMFVKENGHRQAESTADRRGDMDDLLDPSMGPTNLSFIKYHMRRHRRQVKIAQLPMPSDSLKKTASAAAAAASALGSVSEILDKGTEDAGDVHRKSFESAHAFEAANINDQETLDLLAQEQRRQKVLRSAGTFRRHMYDLTESLAFNGFILGVILLNTGIMCALTYDTVAVRAGWHATVLDHVFLVIYFMECVLKLYVWRLDYFKEQWNIVDFTIVVVNIADFSVSTLVGNDVNILNFIGIFRAMRALRALRVLRTVRFLKSLQVIMNTCLQSVQSMGAITMLISLFLYMFAVIGRGLYAEVDPKRFGNLGSAMFTLFQLLTLDDWFYIYAEAVAKDPGYFHIIFYLVLYIAFEYFIFLNLFVAVLVDNFQLTLEAAAAKEAIRKEAIKVEEEDTDEDTHDLLPKSRVSSISSEELFRTKRTIEDFYSSDAYSDRDRIYLAHCFRLLAAIDYNGNLSRNQKGTLDKIVDTVQETTDDA
ncbi:cation channel sperm-associated protein 1-like isoform X1 [Acanthaster planci]|uniref:Cation channel sperm-associated protein 1-like isoform X1 n=1 Tax=Acanthaster planci TaxID=133434 RepID=A0A8B7XNG4_ACAPL|nr:cation channel sperm-associated protein 1-like isoform X1 [Acanthaster planci]